MKTTIRARYDGKVLHPIEPLDLPADSEVEITIEHHENGSSGDNYCFLDTALSLGIEGPVDWSTRVEEILYGHLDRSDE